MEETFVSFETAKLAKEKGFDIHCKKYFNQKNGECYENMDFPYNSFNGNLFAPTQALLQKWLRGVHNVHVYLNPKFDLINPETVNYFWVILCNKHNKIEQKASYGVGGSYWTIYEEALEEALKEALRLIK